jgi:protein-S-isoprenylcysteine O-methyltransferase Ste14
VPINRSALFLRLVTSAGLSIFLYRAINAWLAYRQINLLILIVVEALTVVLVLIAKPPAETRVDPISVTVTVLATFYFLAIDLLPGRSLLPQAATLAIQCSGLLLQLVSKLTLRRNFGLLPARRDIVTRGPYRFIRHPIYAGYFLNITGYFLSAASLYNAVVFLAYFGLQLVRIAREESLLMGSEAYRAYAQRTRWRLIPGLL